MKRVTYSVGILVIWGVLTGCSQPTSISAPANPQEAQERFIIQGSDADTEKVLASSRGYRVISEKHHIYEVAGLNYYDIKSIAPSVQAEQNEYFQALDIKKPANPYAAYMMQAEPEDDSQSPETEEGSTIGNIPQIPPALQGCDLEAKAQPTPKLTVINDVLQTSPTMNLGETVVFSDNGTTPLDPESEEAVTFQWDILAPSGSETKAGLRTGKTLELKVDMVGLYQVIFVAKDPSNACAVIPAQFMVTHNPEIEFPIEGEEMPMAKLEAFTHLKRMDVEDAWKLATGKGVKIAVLDSGVHYNHLGIKFNLQTNESEMSGDDDTDDDGNGFKDDVLGWDFINNDNRPFDDQGHGSHVSGLAASHIHGVAKGAKVIPVKVLSAAGGGDVASVIAGVYYAVDSGADIINASLGGFQSKVESFREALNYAHENGVTFISASGNSTLDLSLPGNDIFPGELDVPNIINVAAVGFDQNLASYSNFGKLEVDVAAPGGDQQEPMFSLATMNPRNVPFIGLGGTSMAAPVVAGVAALMIEANPSITPEEIRLAMMISGESHPELTDVVGSGRILSALEAVENATPEAIQIANTNLKN